jgi:hypothetical protein
MRPEQRPKDNSKVFWTDSASSAQSKVREKELMEKYMQNVSKFDKGHMIAMTEHVLYPKASTENQGRAIDNIILSIDTKTQGLIEIYSK